MTAVSAEIGRGTSAGRGDVFAAGSDGRRRRAWIAGGTALLVVAYFDWLVGDWSPGLAPLARTSALLLGLVGAAIVGVALWRRTRRYEVSAAGILLSHGGSLFGDRQLVPWESITEFSGRRAGPEGVCLVFRQQHIPRERKLPGRPLSIEEYDRLIDRLRVVIGERCGHLVLGGLAEG